MTITRLLVANRGEIARRIFRTCRELGIETVAVHSEADAGLPFVAEADAAVPLAGSAAGETYLRGDLVVAAALRAGADAVHPGYGFLSESADLARQVLDAGLTWVGPAPASIEAMGSKVEAKKLMEAAGVPVLTAVDPATATEADLPLLVKASAGGGGRGMRVVRRLDALPATVEQAGNEAAAAFGDATVFCEPYVEHGRHVEVQVLGDTHGTVAVLGDRDCSIQRRHQKVIEEAPAPGLRDETRHALHEAARTAAVAIDYVGAGTVEFLLDPQTERFWFLEMNTRLQVEHPVTECVFGVDLVAQQLHVAEGRVLGDGISTGSTGRGQGHAVEARLYAEDPARDWQPQSGRLLRLEVPGTSSAFAAPAAYGIRVDSGYESGTEVGTHYDAMLAKVVAWAPTREQALRRLAATLAGARIHGVRTNRDLLVRTLRHPAVLSGEVSTDFFDRHDLAQLAAPLVDGRGARLGAFAAAVALAERDRAGRAVQSGIPAGWRSVVSQPQVTRFATDEEEVAAGWYGGRDGYRPADLDGVRVLEATARRVLLTDGSPGVVRAFEVHAAGDRVDVESSLGHVALRLLPRFADPADRVASGSLLAPMPGTVVGVAVSEGQHVRAGDPVLVLEAMKMQHTVSAPHPGVVAAVSVTAGQQVLAGAVLAVVEEERA